MVQVQGNEIEKDVFQGGQIAHLLQFFQQISVELTRGSERVTLGL